MFYSISIVVFYDVLKLGGKDQEKPFPAMEQRYSFFTGEYTVREAGYRHEREYEESDKNNRKWRAVNADSNGETEKRV